MKYPYTIYYDYKNRWWVLSNRTTRIKCFKSFDKALSIYYEKENKK